MVDESNGSDGKLQETILMFEQILEVMPDDEMALRTLYDAYTQTGQREKAFTMLKRLSEMVLEFGETELVDFLVGQYGEFSDMADDASAKLQEQLKAQQSSGGDEGEAAPEVEKKALTDIKRVEVGEEDRKDAELTLAFNLFQDGLLSQDDYTQVLQDLTEMSAKDVAVPVTVLHVLSDRSFSHFSAVVTYMSKQTGTPYISLANFEVSDDVLAILPLDFVQHNAAVCFSVIGDELLIAGLNPFDKKLLRTVEEMTGRKVHPYMVGPEEYDELLKRIAELQKGV